MTTLAAPTMTRKASEVCTYASIRIDDQILPLARAAAALSGDVTVQEFVSDAVNEVASRLLNRPLVARRRAPDKPRGPGRPRKKS